MPRRPPGSGAMSVWLRPGPTPRQPTPALSRDEITRVAIELADRGGLEAVSMRRIGARIGSAPTSLYWYISDKDELYELMVDAVIGQVPLLERPSGDWRADLAAIAWAARATLSSHPWFAQVGIHPVAGPQTLRFGAMALRSFEGLGLDQETEINILAAVNNYIYGFVQREVAWHRFAARAEPGAAPAHEDEISAEHLAARTKLHGDESFAFGLDCLLTGFAVRVARAGVHGELAAAMAARPVGWPGATRGTCRTSGLAPIRTRPHVWRRRRRPWRPWPNAGPSRFALKVLGGEMAEVTLAIGAAAVCRDGFPGELKGLVVEPSTRAVTHLVIEPEHAQGLARLVPLDHADATAEPIRLRYTEAEFKDLGPAEETLAEFVPGYEVPVQLLPSGEGWRPADGPVADGETIPQIREMETIPLVPGTEVEESGGDNVHATDGHVGHLHGLRVDPDNGRVLSVLIKRHPWGHAEVAIPIGKVSGFEAGVQLSITKQEVKDLTA